VGVPRYLDYAGDIRRSGGQLLQLIERMLDLSEAEVNRLTLAKATVRPGEVLQDALAALQPFAQKKSVAIKVEAEISVLTMTGDTVRLRQAFTNLLHNAIKFTPAGGEVCVSVRARSGVLSIQIADSGVGMPPELLASVVRPFHRLRSALDGQDQGAGLGLPYAKAIIDLHGGTLTLASEVGRGTSVTIELPVEADALSRAA
jgi:signal transduction histidine kinase